MISYKPKTFRENTQDVIDKANKIIKEYRDDGYDLTLRQLYYQFVARDLFPEERRWTWTGKKWKKDPQGTKNAEPNYKWLGNAINSGRLVGQVDWDSIVDRTRSIKELSHWTSPADIIRACASQFRFDTRKDQDYYVEVWVEKEAMAGVLQKACDPLDVPWLSCKGYVSQSAMWRAAQRLINYETRGRTTIILYLGDHDPSGIDMSRDIQDRLKMFNSDVQIIRIALNMGQIEELQPPPSPAKITDSRYDKYLHAFGDDSWELDALDPRTITELIRENVTTFTEDEKREAWLIKQDKARAKIQEIAEGMVD